MKRIVCIDIDIYLSLLPSPVAAWATSLDTWWWQCSIRMMIFSKLQDDLELCWQVLEIRPDSPGKPRKGERAKGMNAFWNRWHLLQYSSEGNRIIAPFLTLKPLIKGDKITNNYLKYLEYRIDGRPHDLPFHWTIIPGAEKGSCHCQSRSQKRAETLFHFFPSAFCGQ